MQNQHEPNFRYPVLYPTTQGEVIEFLYRGIRDVLAIGEFCDFSTYDLLMEPLTERRQSADVKP